MMDNYENKIIRYLLSPGLFIFYGIRRSNDLPDWIEKRLTISHCANPISGFVKNVS
jgi:hypothetical protein